MHRLRLALFCVVWASVSIGSGACVTGTDPQDSSTEVGAEVSEDTGGGEVDVDTAEVGDDASDGDAVDVPDASEVGPDGDAGAYDGEVLECDGCQVGDECVAFGAACPDDNATDCTFPVCISSTGECTGSQNLAQDAACSQKGCDGTCSGSACIYPPDSGCAGINLVFVAEKPTFGAGLGGLNAHCKTVADASPNLPDTQWVAWAGISGDGLDHVSRVGDAQAWVRLDGLPFAQTAEDILTGQVLYPPMFNDNGEEANELRIVTGLDADGAFNKNCNAFNAPGGDQVEVGHAGAGNGWLNHYEQMECDSSPSVLCLQVEFTDGTVAPPVGAEAGLAFVTQGDFVSGQGVAAADALCQQEAEAVDGLATGIFRAYVAVDNATPESRFPSSEGWRRPDGLTVFAGQITDDVVAPPTLHADGTYAPTSARLWLGIGNDNCGSWESLTGEAAQLPAGFAHAAWDVSSSKGNCSNGGKLLCFQDTVVDPNSCDLDQCVTPGLNDEGCMDENAVHSDCLVCQPATSRFVLQPVDAACPASSNECVAPSCLKTGDDNATCEEVVMEDAPCTHEQCTIGACDATGSCVQAGVQGPEVGCDDNRECTADDKCDGAGVCAGTSTCAVDNGDPCTEDVCLPGATACTSSPLPSTFTCDDGDVCTLGDTCDGSGGCGNAVSECHPGANLIFTTKEKFNGDLGGLAGADQKCQEAAIAAGHGGTFVAWLSDDSGPSTGDAKGRVGLAQGWVRTGDFEVVAATLDDLIDGAMYHAPNNDEDGAPKQANDSAAQYWTGTAVGGTNLAGQNCDNWTSADSGDTGRTGQIHSNGTLAHDYNAPGCDTALPLRCLQIDETALAEPPPVAAGRIAFISTVEFTATDGLPSADALCQRNAAEAGLQPGIYKALLPTSTASAISRFDTTVTAEPWVDVRGTLVWDSFDLTVPPSVPLNLLADGVVPVAQAHVLTSTTDVTTIGTLASTCNDWRDPDGANTYERRQPGFSQANWFSGSAPPQACGQPVAVYCLQDTHANYAFVTSSTYDGNLGGVTGADAKCQAAAGPVSGANLPGTYRAWISTASETALLRFQGLPQPPSGWIRPDGKPLADTLEDFAGGRFFRPVNRNELGEPAGNVLPWTDKNSFDEDCDGWTLTGSSGIVGESQMANAFGLFRSSRLCTSEHPLICLGVDRQGTVQPEPQTGRPVFTSTKSFATDSGLAGADAVCQADAVASGLRQGNYKALLATEGKTAISRFDTTGEPWVSVKGVRLAPLAVTLAEDAALETGIALRADGLSPLASGNSWSALGAPRRTTAGVVGETCDDWSLNQSGVVFRAGPPGSANDSATHQNYNCSNAPADLRSVQCMLDVPANYVFTTATLHTGDLGGRAGADLKCQAAAEEAGLGGTFKAWLYDGTMTAVEAIGSGVNGFMRMDSRPVAGTLDDFAAGKHWYPANRNQFGAAMQQALAVWSGSPRPIGPPAHCLDWTSSSGDEYSTPGANDGASPAFEYSNNYRACNVAAHLRCVQVDFDTTVTPPPRIPGRPAFISSGLFDTDSTRQEADDMCNEEAIEAGLRPGLYRALLGTQTESAISRFDQFGEPWVRVDGLLINETVADFVDFATRPIAPINSEADGDPVPTKSTEDWVISSGPDMTNATTTTSCKDWSVTDASGTKGNRINGLVIDAWLSAPSPASCAIYPQGRVYCLLDIPD